MVRLGIDYPLLIAETKQSMRDSMFNRWNDSGLVFNSMVFFCCTTTTPSYRQYDQGSQSNAWLGNAAAPTVLCRLGTNGFPSLLNAMRSVSFSTDAELRVWLDECLWSKPGDFYQHDIKDFVECLEDVVNNK